MASRDTSEGLTQTKGPISKMIHSDDQELADTLVLCYVDISLGLFKYSEGFMWPLVSPRASDLREIKTKTAVS